LRGGRPDLRLYGQLNLADAFELPRLAATLPDEAATISGNTLDIDFEGFYADVDGYLELAASCMRPGDSGHLDVFDEEHRVLTRYELAPGGHASKSHRYDDILEHTKGEGNW